MHTIGESRRFWLLAVAASLAAAYISILIQGTEIGVGNNYFHLEIMTRLYDLPQFSNDQFTQSLHRFVSFIYPMLSWVSTDSNLYALLLTMDFITRFAYILAMLLVAVSVSDAAKFRAADYMLLLVILGLMYGSSPVGIAGLFAISFSHTELAQALALFSILFAVRQQYVWAALAWAFTFDLNAFVGVWSVVPIALLAGDSLLREGRSVVPALLKAAGIAAVVAAPVFIWILTLVGGEKVNFSYVGYLREFFPYHFLIDVAKPYNLAFLLCYTLAGTAALKLLPGNKRWTLAYIGYIAVFLLGIPVPYVLNAPNIINLHLLRVDGMVVSLAVAFMLSVAASMDLKSHTRNVLLAVLALGYWPTNFANITSHIFLLIPTVLLAIASLAFYAGIAQYIVFSRSRDDLRRMLPLLVLIGASILITLEHGRMVDPNVPQMWLAVLATLGGCVVIAFRAIAYTPIPLVEILLALRVLVGDYAFNPSAAAPTVNELTRVHTSAQEWQQVAEWARDHTPTDAVFLVPTNLANFSYIAKRVTWWNFAQGSAVLWAPSFYDTWHKRKEAVMAADTLSKQVSYACSNRISYIIVDLRPKLAGDDIRVAIDQAEAKAVYQNQWFKVFQPLCPNREAKVMSGH
jgi:hypothetical protein